MSNSGSAGQAGSERSSDADRRLNQVVCDLHDGLLQYVIAARMVNEALRRKLAASTQPVPPEVDSVEKYLQQAITEGRTLISQLQTTERHELDLVGAIQELLSGLAAEGQVRCDVHVGTDMPLDHLIRDAVFRIVQEAVSNVRRHSQATTVRVNLRREDDSVVLEIVDDGQGFDPAAPRPGHWGLAGMRQRVESLGGKLRIESAADRGTRVIAQLPIAAADDPKQAQNP